jgi:hypothetical protein
MPCPAGANPAEWMLQVIEPHTDGSNGPDWHRIWLDSPEYQAVKEELHNLRTPHATDRTIDDGVTNEKNSQYQEFVASFWPQFGLVLWRTWRHLWRSPTYIWSKTILILLSVRQPFSLHLPTMHRLMLSAIPVSLSGI